MKESYEASYLISGQAGEEAVQQLSQTVNEFIQSKEGSISESRTPQRTVLAYPIKKENSAFLQVTRFLLTPGNLAEVEKKLRETKGVLRFLVVKRRPVRARSLRPRRIKEPDKAGKFVSGENKEAETPKVELEEIGKKLDEILK